MPVTHIVATVGRALIALLFILAGVAKIAGPKPYLAHMAELKIPGLLLYPVIALEVGAGGILLFGFWLPYSAGALAVFCVLTALVFHTRLSDRAERTQFVKDLAIAGGLMAIAAAAL